MAPGDFVHLVLEPPREPLLIPPPSPERLVTTSGGQMQMWLDVATQLVRAFRMLVWTLTQAVDVVLGDVTPQLHLQSPRMPTVLAAADDFHAAYRTTELYLAWASRVKMCVEARMAFLASSQENDEEANREHGVLVTLAVILEPCTSSLRALSEMFERAARQKAWHLPRAMDCAVKCNDLISVFVMMM